MLKIDRGLNPIVILADTINSNIGNGYDTGIVLTSGTDMYKRELRFCNTFLDLPTNIKDEIENKLITDMVKAMYESENEQYKARSIDGVDFLLGYIKINTKKKILLHKVLDSHKDDIDADLYNEISSSIDKADGFFFNESLIDK